MTEKESIVHITVDMKGELAEKAKAVKKYTGMTQWTDVVRYLFTQYHREHVE